VLQCVAVCYSVLQCVAVLEAAVELQYCRVVESRCAIRLYYNLVLRLYHNLVL